MLIYNFTFIDEGAVRGGPGVIFPRSFPFFPFHFSLLSLFKSLIFSPLDWEGVHVPPCQPPATLLLIFLSSYCCFLLLGYYRYL